MGTGASKPNEDFCLICDTKFNPITKRKRQCLECNYNICLDCLVSTNTQSQSTTGSGTPTRSSITRALRTTVGNCKHCHILLSEDPTYQSLNQLNVRRLREFLVRRNVTDLSNCTEKSDLVELILERFGGESHRQTILERENRTQDLLARQRVHPEGSTGATPPPPPEEAPPEPEAYAEDTEERSSTATDSEIKQDNDTISKISLSEIESESEIENLNAKQLKIILTRNLVEYKGCKEKHELISRVKMLWESRKANQLLYEKLLNPQVPEDGVPPHPDEKELCKICMDSAIDCVLLDCGHMVTCTKCGKQMNECPICRQYVVRAVHIFRA